MLWENPNSGGGSRRWSREELTGRALKELVSGAGRETARGSTEPIDAGGSGVPTKLSPPAPEPCPRPHHLPVALNISNGKLQRM